MPAGYLFPLARHLFTVGILTFCDRVHDEGTAKKITGSGRNCKFQKTGRLRYGRVGVL